MSGLTGTLDLPSPLYVDTSSPVTVRSDIATPSTPSRTLVSGFENIGKMKYKIEAYLPAETTKENIDLFMVAFKDQILKTIVNDPKFHPKGVFTVSLEERAFSATDTTTGEIQKFDIPTENETTKKIIRCIRGVLLKSYTPTSIQKHWTELRSSLPPPLINAVHIPQGIKRLGQNCWINATLQLLMSSKTFQEWIEQQADEKSNLYPLHRFFKIYTQQIKGELDSQKIREMITAQQSDISCDKNTQQDANTALSHILSFYPEEKKGQLQKISTYKPDKTTTINERSALLSVAITDSASLQEMLESHFSETPHDQHITEKDSNGTETKYQAVRVETSYVTAPPELWIQIKRFKNKDKKVSKDEREIDIPDKITVPLANGSKASYKLTGHINHKGDLDSGHYKAYIQAEDKLYCCNDEQVDITPDAEREAARSQAYLLHYELEKSIDPI